jgi:hypothetical protein
MINYNLVVYIGVGLIIIGFILFIISEMKCSQLDREKWLSDELSKSFNKQKEKEYFEYRFKKLKIPHFAKKYMGKNE